MLLLKETNSKLHDTVVESWSLLEQVYSSTQQFSLRSWIRQLGTITRPIKRLHLGIHQSIIIWLYPAASSVGGLEKACSSWYSPHHQTCTPFWTGLLNSSSQTGEKTYGQFTNLSTRKHGGTAGWSDRCSAKVDLLILHSKEVRDDQHHPAIVLWSTIRATMGSWWCLNYPFYVSFHLWPRAIVFLLVVLKISAFPGTFTSLPSPTLVITDPAPDEHLLPSS